MTRDPCISSIFPVTNSFSLYLWVSQPNFPVINVIKCTTKNLKGHDCTYLNDNELTRCTASQHSSSTRVMFQNDVSSTHSMFIKTIVAQSAFFLQSFIYTLSPFDQLLYMFVDNMAELQVLRLTIVSLYLQEYACTL